MTIFIFKIRLRLSMIIKRLLIFSLFLSEVKEITVNFWYLKKIKLNESLRSDTF